VSDLGDRLRSSPASDRILATIVFGSVARGDVDAQSDLDVLIVVMTTPPAATS